MIKDIFITILLSCFPFIFIYLFNIRAENNFQFLIISLLYIPFLIYVIKRRK